MAADRDNRISTKQVEHLAELARIELTEEEKDVLTGQLNAVLDYFRILDEADTENIQPILSVLELNNVWREDAPKSSLKVEDVLEGVPRKEKNYIRSPRIA
jgi:aspartyl-tRNA(Asn)/glutamyl-tRNA(Gln) amidotransferase subunit C